MKEEQGTTQEEGTDEEAVLGFLEDVWGAGVKVEIIETHAARVLLAGDRALKIKKRVRFPFLDFTTLAARQQALARELELNKPHAPEIYVGLHTITRESDGRLALDGAGIAIDLALEMRRFDQRDILVEVAARGAFDASLARALAEMVAGYHQAVRAVYDADAVKLVANAAHPLLEALALAGDRLDQGEVARLRAGLEAAMSRLAPLLEARARGGAVRRCHGDLHLGNIVLIGHRPVAFDALEFDEALATIDVLYDLAFLLMDLIKRGQSVAANLVFNGYLRLSPLGNELEGLAALPLFLSLRAAVRAVVALARANQVSADRPAEELLTRSLVALASSFIAPAPPRLVAIGGFSGTGKSTIAASLAPAIGSAPGALHIRTDVVRKDLFGVGETEKLSKDHYSEAVSEEVYRIVLNKAVRALRAGHSVVVDAVFSKLHERQACEAAALEAGCPFAGVWLDAPADVLLERVKQRKGDASDADVSVVTTQLAYKTGPIAWVRINTRGNKEENVTAVTARLSALVAVS
ncbi:MAG: AAA family ATPase [Hyphomicrobium sp.]